MSYECLMPRCAELTEQHKGVCEYCWEDRRGQLAAIPDMWLTTYLGIFPQKSRRAIDMVKLAPPGPGVPFNLVAYDVLEHAALRLTTWANWLYTLLGNGSLVLSGYQQGALVAYSSALLCEYDYKFRRASYVGDYVHEVWTVYRRLMLQTTSTDPRRIDTPCPACDMATVVTRHADEYAQCLTCGTEWPHSRLLIMIRKMAA